MKRILNGFLILLITLLISTAYVAGLILIYQLYKSTDNPAYLLVYAVNFGVITWMLGKDED
jgi:hypothetical protein